MREWIDLNKNLTQNFSPSGGDITTKDIESIKNSIRNIFNIRKGELPGDPFFGNSFDAYLFQLITPDLNILFQEDVRLTLKRYEPRVVLKSCALIENADYNEVVVKLNFYIKDDTNKREFEMKMPFYQN